MATYLRSKCMMTLTFAVLAGAASVAEAQHVHLPTLDERPIKAAGMRAARAEQCGVSSDAYRTRYLDRLLASGASPAQLETARGYFDASREAARSVFAEHPCAEEERERLRREMGGE